MPEYSRKDGGKTNTDYRGRDAHLAEDGTVFAASNPFGEETPDGVYERDDGGVVDTRYRSRDTYLAEDGTLFAGSEQDDE